MTIKLWTYTYSNFYLCSGHERGRAGGGWGDGNEASSSPSQSLRSGYRHVHSPVSNQPQNNGAVNVVGGVSGGMARDQEASYTEQERLLVEEITAPGGVRAAPPRESLNTFINRSEMPRQPLIEVI